MLVGPKQGKLLFSQISTWTVKTTQERMWVQILMSPKCLRRGFRQWSEEQHGKARDQQRMVSPGESRPGRIGAHGWLQYTVYDAGIQGRVKELFFVDWLGWAAGAWGWGQEKKQGQLLLRGGGENQQDGRTFVLRFSGAVLTILRYVLL